MAALTSALLLWPLAIHAQAPTSGWLLTFSSTSGATGTLAFNGGTANPASIYWTAPTTSTSILTVPGVDVASGTGCGPLQTWSVDATAALTFTITGTWQGSGPPPPSVTLTETSLAGYSGSGTLNSGTAADGLNDPLVATSSGGLSQTSSSGTPAHYSVQTGSTWHINRTLSATGHASGTAPYNGGSGGGMGVHLGNYTVSTVPIAINLTGPATDSHGNLILDGSGNAQILVGQHCTASLSGLPGGTGWTTTYAWSVSGTTFQTWSSDTPAVGGAPYNADASYYVSGPGPLTNPTAQWFWNDLQQTQTETVSCTAAVTPPAGQGNAFTMTVSKNVTVLRPIWIATGTGGTMQVNASAPNDPNYELWAGPTTGTTEDGGMTWTASVSSPNPALFGNGSLILVQLIDTLDLSYTAYNAFHVLSTYTWSQNGEQGLDTQYPYGWLQGALNYTSNDTPGTALDNTKLSAHLNDQFEDYLMYFAPNSTQCVPLSRLVWSASGDVTLPNTGNWANFGAGSAGTITPSGTASFQRYNTFPMWTTIINTSEGHF